LDSTLPAHLKAAAGRVLCTAALLGAAAAMWGDALLRAMLPALALAIAWLEPAFALQHLDLVQTPAGSRVRAQVMLAHTIVVGQGVIVPHPLGQAFAWVPATAAWQLPLLMAVTVAAYPARNWREWPRRGCAFVLAVPALAVLDLPVVLTAEFWRPLMAVHDVDGWQLHVVWSDFLHQGGRVCVALVCGTAVVAVSRAAGRSRRVVDGAAPGAPGRA
jgi:hypothetical protein